ncbi:glycerate kinase [Actinotignum urinale]|uniref:Glycerate kinase n=1 Tax=Actinotignum urinale TaxID=190146 RepID=A0AAW9HZ79_9ACTO|nr:glycerate kinase [Actinotignum urinale]MDY5155156.1 glycerate kinase [Actinotignum urinale]
MKIVCCPDSFKESMTAAQAASALAEGIRMVVPDADIVEVPMADGGEGFAQSLRDALNARVFPVPVEGIQGYTVEAELAMSGKTAIIEAASAVGLGQVAPEYRDIRAADTFGLGELILRALDEGATDILIGLGGSGTDDGGAGMLRALGMRFYDDEGDPIGTTPTELERLTFIDTDGLDERLHNVTLRVACDVDNPLLGWRGASAVYGPQKGATDEDILFLDSVLRNFVEVSGKDDVHELPGAGAAGGLGFAFLAFLGARLESGVDLVMETIGLRETIRGATIIFTGEGSMDRQTLMGKTLSGIARIAREEGNIPIIAFAGHLGEGVEELYDSGFVGLVPIVDKPCTMRDALQEGYVNLVHASKRVMKLLQIGATLS